VKITGLRCAASRAEAVADVVLSSPAYLCMVYLWCDSLLFLPLRRLPYKDHRNLLGVPTFNFLRPIFARRSSQQVVTANHIKSAIKISSPLRLPSSNNARPLRFGFKCVPGRKVVWQVEPFTSSHMPSVVNNLRPEDKE